MNEQKILCDKIAYTKEEAISRAAGMSRKKKVGMKHYKCRECGFYHLATKGKKINHIQKSVSKNIEGRKFNQPKPKKSKKSKYLNVPAVQNLLININKK